MHETQGRITFIEEGDANHYAMLTEDGRWMMAMLANGESTSAQQVANFRRLAACWNACVGVPTEELEAITLVGRQPPTDDEVYKAIKGVNSLDALAVWRCAERAHGITGESK